MSTEPLPASSGFARPSLVLLVFLGGLSLFAETVYTPSLPDIARSLGASARMVEHTLTIYLAAFAPGILCWGILSDRAGRKPCMLAGLACFTAGCLLCRGASSIESLLLARALQGFGASSGSVLSQAITRDSFQGPALVRAYAAVGSALAVFPALGPVVGSFVLAFSAAWNSIFVCLAATGLVLAAIVVLCLPETHPAPHRIRVSVAATGRRMIRDPWVLGLAVAVGCGNGIYFSYFAEASFVLIKVLGLSPFQYGTTFWATASMAFLAAMLRVFSRTPAQRSVLHGLLITTVSAALTAFLATLWVWAGTGPNILAVIILVAGQSGMAFGLSLSNGSCLAIALERYRSCTGTASSLFGFTYYIIASGSTGIMALLHNGSILPMPLWFLTLGCLALGGYALAHRAKAPAS